MKKTILTLLLAVLAGYSFASLTPALADDVPVNEQTGKTVSNAPVMMNPNQKTVHYYIDANGQWVKESNDNVLPAYDTSGAYYQTMMRLQKFQNFRPHFNSDSAQINRTIPCTIQKMQ